MASSSPAYAPRAHRFVRSDDSPTVILRMPRELGRSAAILARAAFLAASISSSLSGDGARHPRQIFARSRRTNPSRSSTGKSARPRNVLLVFEPEQSAELVGTANAFRPVIAFELILKLVTTRIGIESAHPSEQPTEGEGGIRRGFIGGHDHCVIAGTECHRYIWRNHARCPQSVGTRRQCESFGRCRRRRSQRRELLRWLASSLRSNQSHVVTVCPVQR